MGQESSNLCARLAELTQIAEEWSCALPQAPLGTWQGLIQAIMTYSVLVNRAQTLLSPEALGPVRRETSDDPEAATAVVDAVAAFLKRFSSALCTAAAWLATRNVDSIRESLEAAFRDSPWRKSMARAVVKSLELTRSFDDRLREYRGDERCALDVGSIFQAWQEADAAVRAGVETEARDWARYLQHKEHDPGLWGVWSHLLRLVTLPHEAVIAHARSVLRAAYKSESPETLESLQAPVGPNEDSPTLGETLASPELPLLERLLHDADVRGAKTELRRRLNALPQRQREIVEEYWRALKSGHRPSSKLGRSMRQFWGADYERKKRALQRVRRQHSDLLNILERLTDL